MTVIATDRLSFVR